MSAADLQVKNLDWVTVEEGQRAITVCGMYAISPKGNKLTLTGMPGDLLGRFDSIEGAKSAAQADYKTRILSAIFTKDGLLEIPRDQR